MWKPLEVIRMEPTVVRQVELPVPDGVVAIPADLPQRFKGLLVAHFAADQGRGRRLVTFWRDQRTFDAQREAFCATLWPAARVTSEADVTGSVWASRRRDFFSSLAGRITAASALATALVVLWNAIVSAVSPPEAVAFVVNEGENVLAGKTLRAGFVIQNDAKTVNRVSLAAALRAEDGADAGSKFFLDWPVKRLDPESYAANIASGQIDKPGHYTLEVSGAMKAGFLRAPRTMEPLGIPVKVWDRTPTATAIVAMPSDGLPGACDLTSSLEVGREFKNGLSCEASMTDVDDIRAVVPTNSPGLRFFGKFRKAGTAENSAGSVRWEFGPTGPFTSEPITLRLIGNSPGIAAEECTRLAVRTKVVCVAGAPAGR